MYFVSQAMLYIVGSESTEQKKLCAIVQEFTCTYPVKFEERDTAWLSVISTAEYQKEEGICTAINILCHLNLATISTDHPSYTFYVVQDEHHDHDRKGNVPESNIVHLSISNKVDLINDISGPLKIMPVTQLKNTPGAWSLDKMNVHVGSKSLEDWSVMFSFRSTYEKPIYLPTTHPLPSNNPDHDIRIKIGQIAYGFGYEFSIKRSEVGYHKDGAKLIMITPQFLKTHHIKFTKLKAERPGTEDFFRIEFPLEGLFSYEFPPESFSSPSNIDA